MIEGLARKGLTDKEIALSIGIAENRFCEKKGEYPELREVLTRARCQINATVRQKYLSIGLGGIKTKSVTKRKIETESGELIDGEVVQETETELPPNPNVLQTWLFHHDPEWKKSVIEGKRLDLTSNGKDMNQEIRVEIIDRREQINDDSNDQSV
jgi:cytoskeletal protein CcmA (bactofilin family)